MNRHDSRGEVDAFMQRQFKAVRVDTDDTSLGTDIGPRTNHFTPMLVVETAPKQEKHVIVD